MKIVMTLALIPGLLACSGSDFSSAKSLGDEGGGGGSSAGQPTDEENEIADEPVMVSGTYLTLGCTGLSKGDKDDRLKELSSGYGCGLFGPGMLPYTGPVKGVSCQNSAAADLKVFEDQLNGPWHFLLAMETEEKDPLKDTSCQMTAGGESVAFATAESVSRDIFDLRKVFELTFDQASCWVPDINVLTDVPPQVSLPGCNVSGKKGTAFQFNGMSSFLRLPLADRLADFFEGDYSVSFWFRTPGPSAGNSSSYMSLISQLNDSPDQEVALDLRYCSAGDCAGELTAMLGDKKDPDTENTETRMIPDTWYHIALTKKGYDFDLYLNGTHQGREDLDSKKVRLDSDLLIGRSGFAGEYLQGSLDEFAMWSGALSENQIRDIMRIDVPLR